VADNARGATENMLSGEWKFWNRGGDLFLRFKCKANITDGLLLQPGRMGLDPAPCRRIYCGSVLVLDLVPRQDSVRPGRSHRSG
jgi:hypothetical protein